MLEQLSFVAEIIGAVVIVISLVYVGVQIKDSTRAVRSAAMNDANEAVQAFYIMLASNRQVSELFLKGLLSDEPLPKDDEYQFLMTAHAAMIAFQNSFLLTREGTLDKELRDSINAAIRGVAGLPGLARYWEQRRGYLQEAFAEYVDELMTQDPSGMGGIYR